MTTTLPDDQRLHAISPKAYEHPADRAATAALKSIPMLDAVVRRLIEYGYERALRQELLAASVRLGPDQLPDVYTSHRAALARLDLDEDHDLYLTQFPITNAAAIGSGKPMVLVNSRTVELLDEHGAAHRPRPRGGPHPVRPRALPHGADHPAQHQRDRAACR